MDKKVRTRFAPSPTGRMHVGNLRTALYAYLIAKHEGGDFLLRIEDTDQERFVEGAVEIINRTLEKTGLIHDEGPDKDGGCGPYVQSERQAAGIYMEYAKSYYYSNYGVIVNEYGKENLPKVIETNVKKVEPAEYTYFDSPCEGYDVTLEVVYEDSKLPKSMLKTSMVVSVMNISDFDFNREYDYQDVATIFEGEMKDCWRVLAVQ